MWPKAKCTQDGLYYYVQYIASSAGCLFLNIHGGCLAKALQCLRSYLVEGSEDKTRPCEEGGNRMQLQLVKCQ